MPKRRKAEVKEAEGATPERPLEGEESKVKAERMSQDGKRTSQSSQDVELSQMSQSLSGRNLRPRKSTCYAEKDSPEIEVLKISRKRRRPNTAEACIASDEKEGGQAVKVKRKGKLHPSEGTDKDDQLVPEKPAVAAIIPAKKIRAANSNEKIKELANLDEPSTSPPIRTVQNAEGTETLAKKPTRRRKKPVKKPSTGVEAEGDETQVIPKIEPESPSKKLIDDEASAATADESASVKLVPKKRIRKRKAKTTDEKVDEDKDAEEKPGQNDKVVKKEEAGDSETKVGLGESKLIPEAGDGDIKEEKQSPAKKPVKRKRRVKKKDAEPLKVEAKEGSQEDKEVKPADAENDASKTETAAVKKKVKRRSKKIPLAEPVKSEDGGAAAGTNETNSTNPEAVACSSNNNSTIPIVPVGPEVGQTNENEKHATLHPSISRKITGPPSLPAPIIRRPGFFRGRRSKTLSSRTGKKEVIHVEEPIDPEELRGYEHVERYVTPPGVKLSKFWDSEDELSDDDSSDNFRRIMCAFGANCRVHEVIRPASEIVRRLKELQNTFGASRTLPLFPKKEGDANVSAPSQDDCEERNVHHNIIWHNDPSFYKYANNFP